jgi:hypothetical protein
MNQFKYVLPSGAKFSMQVSAGITQTQANFIFYSQVASGALVNFAPGQSVSGTTSSLAKFALSRLDRGTAGVDDAVILSIVNGLPSAAVGIPTLVDTPLTRPITQADIVSISSTGFTAPAIGELTSEQIQALMAQVANLIDQPWDTASDETGVGRYGLNCQQLEIAGYVKPGTWQQFLQDGTNTLINVLNSPGVWTGLDNINSLQDFLDSTDAQNNAQAALMINGYSSLQAAGVITTPPPPVEPVMLAEIYSDAAAPLTAAAGTVTNVVNNQVASLITNSSQYGTQLTARWASGLPATGAAAAGTGSAATTDLGLLGIAGFAVGLISQIPNLGILDSGTATEMNVLGKASQYAAAATSVVTSATNIADTSVKAVSQVASTAEKLGVIGAKAEAAQFASDVAAFNGAVGDAVGKITGEVNLITDQITAEIKTVANDIAASIKDFFSSDTTSGISGLGDIAGGFGGIDTTSSLSGLGDIPGLDIGLDIGLSEILSVVSVVSSLFSAFGGGGGGGGGFSFSGINTLDSKVQPIPAYTNTVNRAAIDVATAKIIGSDKIPLPSFGVVVPQSPSVAAELDIAKGKLELASLRSQGIALAEQVTSTANRVSQAVTNSNQFGIQVPNLSNFA